MGDAEGALRWLQDPWRDNSEYERLRLLDRAYALTGDTARQIDIRRNTYQRTPGVYTYHAPAELLPEGEPAESRGRACAEVITNQNVVAAAELLFELNEPILADKLIVVRAAELNGGFYGCPDIASGEGEKRWLLPCGYQPRGRYRNSIVK